MRRNRSQLFHLNSVNIKARFEENPWDSYKKIQITSSFECLNFLKKNDIKNLCVIWSYKPAQILYQRTRILNVRLPLTILLQFWEGIKWVLKPKRHPRFYSILLILFRKSLKQGFFGVLVKFHEVTKLQSSEFSVNDVITANVLNISSWFSLHFFVCKIERKPSIKCYGVFDNFSRTYEVVKFWMIKLYLDVCDVIHAN